MSPSLVQRSIPIASTAHPDRSSFPLWTPGVTSTRPRIAPTIGSFSKFWHVARMPKILVSTPTYRSQVHSLYLAGAISAARSPDVGFQTFTHPVISVARNELTKRFLEAKDFDHLLFVDSDIGWQKSDLDTLLAREKDVI